MIEGFIDEHGHPLVEVEVGGSQTSVKVSALVDSGFDGELCLPIEVAIPLGLKLVAVQTIEFADGSTKKELVFDGRLSWEGEFRRAQVYLTAAKQALIGTGLLIERLVTLDFRLGVVRIEK
ncbi:MAG: hypothetical protein ACE5NG_18710 [bacterium]